MNKYDLIVLGSGPGGYAAAIYAAKKGLKTACLEPRQLGGTCLHRGCIPTKALLAGVDLWRGICESANFGIKLEKCMIDYAKLADRKDRIVSIQEKGISFLFKKYGVTLLRGYGKFHSEREIKLLVTDEKGALTGKEEMLVFDKAIIATGSEPAEIDGIAVDQKNILDSTGILALREIPESLLIIGGGVAGCEFASLFARLGTKVMIIEMLPGILNNEDEEVVKYLLDEFRREKVDIYTQARVQSIEITGNGPVVTFVAQDGKETMLKPEKVLVSVGRKLNSKELGLENIGIILEKGSVPVNERMETTVKNIYAIGDVTGKLLLAHAAGRQAVVAVENLTGGRAVMDYKAIPNCIYTTPEIASVGMSEKDALNKGHEVVTGKFEYTSLARARITGENRGIFKIIADKIDDRILGVSIAGAHATELIGEAAVAVSLSMKAAEMGDIVHAHPTLAEGFMEALHDVHGMSVHK